MTTYRLDRLLNPRSIALVGASPRDQSVGRKILANLRRAEFPGPIHLVNPHYPEIEGVKSVANVGDLSAIDLLIVASPPESVPDIVDTAGKHGCSAAVIITSGLGKGEGSLMEVTRQAASRHGVRLLGPNCLGIQMPRAKLDASFSAHMAMPGELAVISQSGAIAAGMVEWAAQRSVGFSAVVSLGNQIDADFGDLLDYFATDTATRAIVLYIESIQDAPKFMSAARAAARAKPVIAIKAGRHMQAATAARTHTGALAGTDAVYEAAFRRAGLVRVLDLDELFDAAETLSHIHPFPGNRLAILSNGGGMGVLAVDRLLDLGGQLAEIGGDASRSLDALLPPTWSKANPVDIVGDADAHRYAATLDALLTDPSNDGILVINVPTALASAQAAAGAVAAAVRKHRNEHGFSKPVFGIWVGDNGDAAAELEAAGIPHYPSETDALRGFMHLVRYREGLDILMAAPRSAPSGFCPDIEKARAIAKHALEEKRTWLDPTEVAAVLKAYGIPAASVSLARNAAEAVDLARPLLQTGAVVLKILSPDILHKSDIGGVRLHLRSEREVQEAADAILTSARDQNPAARIMGLTVHPMIIRPHSRELIAGIANDKTFGPVVVFGAGGVSVEVINDKAIALPPLDPRLALDLISRTRIARLLEAHRDIPAVDVKALALVLVRLSQLAADVPEISELDLNPLLADRDGVVALDARIAVSQPIPGWRGHPRFSIRPYPKEWEFHGRTRDGMELLIRPVRPEDEPLYVPFLEKVTSEDLRLRFFAAARNFTHAFVARLTQIDYARAMAFAAICKVTGEILGVSRLHILTHGNVAEFAILVRSDVKGRGIGWLLMRTLLDYARAEGVAEVMGEVLAINVRMIQMCEALGFVVTMNDHDAAIRMVRLQLDPLKASPDTKRIAMQSTK